MSVIAVMGRKGGIGKSTIAGNLAAEFVALGRTVVVLDADPQHSLAAWAAQGSGLLRRCVEKIRHGSAEELLDTVRSAQRAADVVLIDTPPGSFDTAYQAALVADLVLLPCGPSPLDFFALKPAVALALQARAERGSKKPRIRLVPSKVMTNTRLGKDLPTSLQELGRQVLPGISQRVVVAEAAVSGLTVREYAAASPAGLEFEQLAKAIDEIVSR
jgi:chromosome partitioning protein